MVYLVTEKTIKKQFTGSNTQPYPFPQTCAVKVCDKTKLGKEDLLALQQEITILQSLGGHDHIVHLYNVYNDPDKCYLVMEYMAGGALVDSLIKLKTYSERDAMHACAQILKALQFCHERKIAHRDIKLQNILLAHTVYKELGLDNIHPSCIKVCDFGFAITPAESHSGLKTSCGTLEYVAPEILLGKSYGYAVDMWSVGVLVYTLLCGYLPFRSKDPEQLKRFIRRCRFEFHDEYWGKVSEEAKDFISSLLTLDPSKRLSASAARKHPWFNRLLVSDVIFHTLDQDRLRLFNIKSKLRTAVFTVVAVNKFTSLGIHFHSMLIGIV
jgi:serine/threonine protein kinase